MLKYAIPTLMLAFVILLSASFACASDSRWYIGNMRERISLNGTWDLRPEHAPSEDWSKDTSSWPNKVEVPGAWELAFDATYNGSGWYRKSFPAPEVPSNHRLWLHFDAAATHAKVWLNGKEVGGHSGDWTPFEFDITDAVDNKNLLVVRIQEDTTNVTRGFNSIAGPHHGGLWQDVYLEIRPKHHIIEPIRITSHFDERKLAIEVKASVPNGAAVEFKVLSKDKATELESTTAKVNNGICE